MLGRCRWGWAASTLGALHLLLRWSLEHAFAKIQQARAGIYQNLRLPVIGGAFGAVGGLLARLNPMGSEPNDKIGHQAAATLLQPGEQRDRITGNLHLPKDQDSALGRLECALQRCSQAEPILKKLKDAVRAGRLPKARPAQLLDQAVEAGIVSNEERQLVQDAEAARAEAIAVDSFTLEEYLAAGKPASNQEQPEHQRS